MNDRDYVNETTGKSGEEGKAIAYMIRSRIRKYGTKGQAMFRRATQVNNNDYRVELIFQAGAARIAERLMVAGL